MSDTTTEQTATEATEAPTPTPTYRYGALETLDPLGAAVAATLGGDWTYEGIDTDPRTHHHGRPVATLVDPYSGARVELRPVFEGTHVIATTFGLPAHDAPPAQPEPGQFGSEGDYKAALTAYNSKAAREEREAYAKRVAPTKPYSATVAVHTDPSPAEALAQAITGRLLPALIGKQKPLTLPPSLHERHQAEQKAAAEAAEQQPDEQAPAEEEPKPARKPRARKTTAA